MSLPRRLLILILAVLAVAALVGFMKHDIGRNAAKAPPASAADGRFWWGRT